jgi:hypothetical protein
MTGFGLGGFGLATRDFFDLDLCLYPIFVESIAQCASGETEEFGRPNLVSAGEGNVDGFDQIAIGGCDDANIDLDVFVAA